MTQPDDRIVKMTLEYDGTNYAGWQRQANVLSVQQAVEEALESYLGEFVRVTGSGRTDSGVHARGQVMSFPIRSTIPAEAMGRGLMAHLPPDIAVVDSQEAPAGFDARRDARMRHYRYFLCNRGPRPALGARYLTHVKGKLNLEKMTAAAQLLSGEHDFSAFRSSACTATRTKLTMQPITITYLPDNIIQLDYRCRSFLHNMVRILTGTIVAAGKGKLSAEDIRIMLESGMRHQQAVTLAPNGLFLWEVSYDEADDAGE